MNPTSRQRRWPAEWEPQDAVLLAWPHAHTDWAPYLDDAQAVYLELACAIAGYESVIIATPEPDRVRAALGRAFQPDCMRICQVPTNDTWARDFGPITVYDGVYPVLLDFRFSGWGDKFTANLDDQVTVSLHAQGVFRDTPIESLDLILEGGSIESDGCGTLLTTSQCLLNPNRNVHLTRDRIEGLLKTHLGVTRILWLEHGALAGDDTDAHIDTLARLAPDNTIVYVTCPDVNDEHHASLKAMQTELQALRTCDDQPYRLVPLPWPQARYETDGHRLPATYANFLVINQAVLVPVYNDPMDAQALDAIRSAFPSRDIVGIDCSVLIRQHGSLHCVTMQLPKGVIS